jgi:polyisoprenoid-binding protein YceI
MEDAGLGLGAFRTGDALGDTMKCYLAVIILVAVGAAPAFAQQDPIADLAKVEGGQFTLDKSHARIIFSTTHFGFSTYYGFFDDFDAKLDFKPAAPATSALTVTINLNGIVTADPKLETNLKSDGFFDVAEFPKATFTANRIEMTGAASGKITGNLALHGVTKPVTLDVTFNGGGNNPMSHVYVLGFDAKGTIKRSDFGIKNFVPFVGDDVALVISCEFDRVSPQK